MIEYRDDLVLGLSPRWRLRPDHGRGLIYKHSINELVWKWVPLPIALTIGLMDGQRPASKIIDDLVQLLDLHGTSEGLVLFKGSIGLSNASDEPFLVEVHNDCVELTRVNIKRFLELRNLSGNSSGLAIGQLQVPIELLFMPTNRCQTNCIYCYAERAPIPNELHLSPGRWCELIDEAGHLGIDMVVFSGGDPLLYPGIELLIERLAKWKIEFVLPTKTFISAPRARQLAEPCSGVGTIQISIDGVRPETIDFLVGRPGFCEQAWASLNHLIRAGARVRTQSIITPLNVSEVPDLVRCLYQVGVRESTITNYSRSFYRHSDSLFLSADQMKQVEEVVTQARVDLDWKGLRCNVGVYDLSVMSHEQKLLLWQKRVGCSGGKSSMGITSTGDVILCEQMPQKDPFIVGNVKEKSLLEVWRSPKIAQFVVPPRESFRKTACEQCGEFDNCHRVHGRCFRDAYFIYENLYHPPPICPKAPAAVRMG